MDKKMTLVHIALLAVGFAAGYLVAKKYKSFSSNPNDPQSQPYIATISMK
jgi:hypothetical protein